MGSSQSSATHTHTDSDSTGSQGCCFKMQTAATRMTCCTRGDSTTTTTTTISVGEGASVSGLMLHVNSTTLPVPAAKPE